MARLSDSEQMIWDLTAKVGALATRTDAVRAIHIADPEDDPQFCMACGDAYPCPTIRALDGTK